MTRDEGWDSVLDVEANMHQDEEEESLEVAERENNVIVGGGIVEEYESSLNALVALVETYAHNTIKIRGSCSDWPVVAPIIK